MGNKAAILFLFFNFFLELSMFHLLRSSKRASACETLLSNGSLSLLGNEALLFRIYLLSALADLPASSKPQKRCYEFPV